MKTICMVDDDDIYKLIFKRGLELSGLLNPLLEFNNGWDALEHFKAINTEHEMPEVILLDIHMCSMDGWEFLDEFHIVKERFEKEIAIYIVSNSFLSKDFERARDTPNVIDYLLKPISFTKLKAILE